uniref:Uncharacterized protein n=1 Tax=Anguilla anguilla TaxID=7936 RepID=A0A0E9XXP9_ANGAN
MFCRVKTSVFHFIFKCNIIMITKQYYTLPANLQTFSLFLGFWIFFRIKITLCKFQDLHKAI